jgi:hypothetical protein
LGPKPCGVICDVLDTVDTVDEARALFEYVQPMQNLIGNRPSSVRMVSCFFLALRDARVASGRHAETGKPTGNKSATSWLGAIGYLAFLDQVGTAVFSKTLGSPHEDPGILRALRSFSTIGGSQEAEALYALRCSLAHDYSLVNRSKKPLRRHLFQLEDDPSAPLITLPLRVWDGDPANVDAADDTIVGIPALCDLGEEIAANVRDCYRRQDLALGIPEGPDWVRHRYAVTIYDR